MLPASSASSRLCSSCLPELCSHRLTRFSDRNKSNVRTLRNLKNTAKQLCLRRSKIFYCVFALNIIQEGKNIPFWELLPPLSFLPPHPPTSISHFSFSPLLSPSSTLLFLQPSSSPFLPFFLDSDSFRKTGMRGKWSHKRRKEGKMDFIIFEGVSFGVPGFSFPLQNTGKQADAEP